MADGTRTRCLSYFPSALSPFPLSCHAQKNAQQGSAAQRSSGFVLRAQRWCWGGEGGGGLRESTAALYITFAGRPPGPLKVQAF